MKATDKPLENENKEDDLDKYGDDMLNSMVFEDQSLYVQEYNDVISTISQICVKLFSKKSRP